MIHKKSFYTNCLIGYDKILYRGVNRGNRITQKIDYHPSLFFPAKNKKTEYNTIYKQQVEKISFDSVLEARKFIKNYEGVDNFQIFGNNRYNYCYLVDNFPDKIDYELNDIWIANIDIETTSENGFPEPEVASEQVIAITVKLNGIFYVFGSGEFTSDKEDVKYFRAKDERHLLQKFIKFWQNNYPDIITGWFINVFDIPYLINRITRLFGSDEALKLSPWKKVSRRSLFLNGKEVETVALDGISHLDYIELYKKFAPKTNQESYSLDYIASVELGEKKLDYKNYGSLRNLYKQNYQKFIEYNIQDVNLVDKIDQKHQLINMVIDLAYDAKVNFSDVFAQVRMWDNIIFNELKPKKIVVPFIENIDHVPYEGAFVKEPIIGFHKWVVSLDINSLYPSLIQMFNISPETLIRNKSLTFFVDDLLSRKIDTTFLKQDNTTMAANGHIFSRDFVGIFPKLMKIKYKERVEFKNKMIEAKKELEKVKEELIKRGL